ncbi:MAG: hypothetical protein GY748_19580 [Planctomycetaceae bacterium]|nr:hypothetical protein [Planctomycetaceae bacterium]
MEGIEIPEAGFRSWLREKRLGAISNAYEIPSVASSGISPSIAIIPFLPKEGGPVEGRFSDMLALEVTRALSRSKLIDVISHLSSRQIDQHTLDLNRIQASLGINYLVYGTTSIDGNEFRIDADFADAKTGRIYWTRAFTGKLSAVLDSSNKVVSELSSQIGQSILSASVELAHSRPLPNVESHALLMSAITFMHRHELASFSKSRVLLEELIRRAPDHSVLHAWLGKWYILSIAQGWSTNVTGDTIKASDCTKRALDINPACSFSLAIDGMILSNNNEALGVAASRFEEAVQIEPNNALAWLMFSRLNMFSGDGKKALKHADRACTLSPIDPHKYFFDIMKASAHSVCEDYLSALKYAQRSLEANPRHTSSHRVKAISLQLMGRTDDARLAVARLMKLEPNLTIENYLKNHPAADLPMGQLWADALQSAGVPVTAIKQ